MKKIPSSIRIKSKIAYEIVWSDLVKNDPDCYAHCDDETRQIIIKTNQSETENWKCLIHEVFHALEFEYKIPLPHKLIELLEAPIFKLLKLNGYLD